MRSARPIDKPRNTASSETNPRRSWLAPRVRGGPETARLEQRRAKLRDFLSKSSSHVTRRWREVDSNPRSPCGGWRLGLLPRSYGKFRRANCGSHLTHRWRKQDSNHRFRVSGDTHKPAADRSPCDRGPRNIELIPQKSAWSCAVHGIGAPAPAAAPGHHAPGLLDTASTNPSQAGAVKRSSI